MDAEHLHKVCCYLKLIHKRLRVTPKIAMQVVPTTHLDLACGLLLTIRSQHAGALLHVELELFVTLSMHPLYLVPIIGSHPEQCRARGTIAVRPTYGQPTAQLMSCNPLIGLSNSTLLSHGTC